MSKIVCLFWHFTHSRIVNNLAIADGEIDFRIIKYDQAYQLKLAIYCLDMKDIEMPYEIGTLNKHEQRYVCALLAVLNLNLF